MQQPSPRRSDSAPAPEPADRPGFHQQVPREGTAEHHHFRLHRVLLAWALVQSAATLALAAALVFLTPLKTVLPVYVEGRDPDGMLVTVRPLAADVSTARLLIESEVRRYVRERHEVVPSLRHMQTRWSYTGPIARRSAQPVWDDFEPQAREILEGIEHTPFSRQVDVLSAVETGTDVWTVDFRTTDRAPQPDSHDQLVHHWKAFLTLGRIQPPPGGLTVAAALSNPLQIAVTHYQTALAD